MRNSYMLMILFVGISSFIFSQSQGPSISEIEKYYNNRDYDSVIISIDNEVDELTKSNSFEALGDFYFELGRYYNQINDYKKSIHFLSLSEKTFTSLNHEEALSFIWHEIAGLYYNKKNYQRAEEYWLKTLAYSKSKNKYFYSNNLINIGEIYRLKRDFKNAMICYDQAIEIKNAIGERENLSIAFLNKAIIYTEMESIDSAQYYFEKAITYANKESSECISLGSCLFHYGEFLHKKGELKKASLQYNYSLEVLDGCEDLLTMVDLLPHLIELYRELRYEDSVFVTSNQLLDITKERYKKEKEKHDFETEARYKVREREQLLEKEKKIIEQEVALVKKKKRIQIILLSTGVLILLLIIWIFRQRTESLKQKNKLIEREKEISEIKVTNKEKENQLMKEKHRLEMHLKNKELATTAMNVVNKNDVLNRIHDLLKDYPEIEEHENSKKVLNEINLSKNIERDWNNFKLHFEKVHADFFKKLYVNYSSLTDEEIKVCSYLRIGLSTNEISQLLNILPNSVNKRRNRLRKKFGLLPEDSLIEFLNKI
ncbi:MAG: LuxR C-terminal-related transcriptional regulator [Crocinitomicaceae bacterium]|nr:LuxR C-terminal-related transcriptional regulator [Crocinitomicaceae bacterium]